MEHGNNFGYASAHLLKGLLHSKEEFYPPLDEPYKLTGSFFAKKSICELISDGNGLIK